MTPLRQRMLEDMQLHGLSARTQQSYLGALRQLAVHYSKAPDLLSEDELRQYFLYLRNDRKAARSTITIALCAIKFLFERTLQRPWPTLELLRPPTEHKLPVVLSVEEVHDILARVHIARYRVCLSVISACGLRLLEGVSLSVPQIDSARMVLHIQGGKGNKDRYVPRPSAPCCSCAPTGAPIDTPSGFSRRWTAPRGPSTPPPSPCLRMACSVPFERQSRKPAFANTPRSIRCATALGARSGVWFVRRRT